MKAFFKKQAETERSWKKRARRLRGTGAQSLREASFFAGLLSVKFSCNFDATNRKFFKK